jgi:hypothetical protein
VKRGAFLHTSVSILYGVRESAQPNTATAVKSNVPSPNAIHSMPVTLPSFQSPTGLGLER